MTENQPDTTTDTPMTETIPQKNIATEMKQSYIDYAMSVIAGRALPDVRDGLKPVHRRILYSMDKENLTHGSSHRKSSSVVGETMGNFHPHGDSAVYDALVRMAQDFSMWGPLVDGQGNFGSIDSDPPAAMRYTEARLDKFGEQLLADIDKETVDFSPNYDDRLEEPDVLPAKFPNLLVNGTSGIAVGMTTNILPHNLSEVIDGTIQYINNPDTTVDDLLELIPGPDFPTGANIMGREDIISAYKTGKGKVRVRAEYDIDYDKNQLVITEIPYLQDKSKLVESIANYVKNGDIEGVSDLRDESDRNGIRIIVQCKQSANIDIVENQLIQKALENTLSINCIALVDGHPQRLSLLDIIHHYVEHRRDVVRRRSQSELADAEERAHILEGRLIAVENSEDLVELIRESENRDTAITSLQEDFYLSQAQAEHIVRMQLGSLTSMEAEEIETEYDDLQETIVYLTKILENSDELDQVIIDELQEVEEEFGRERRTTILDNYTQVDDADLIPEEDVAVLVTDENYLKRMPINTFSSQSRGGKGVIGINLKRGDRVKSLIHTNTHDTVHCYTNHGQVYSIKAYEIPEASRTARGTSAVNVLKLDDNEFVVALIPTGELDTDNYITMTTRQGRVKRTESSEYESVQSTGINAISIEDSDELVDVHVTSGSEDILIATANGKAIRFSESEVRSVGRVSLGVNGIKLRDDDVVASSTVITDESSTLLTLTENGFGKQTSLDEHRNQSRYGLGIRNIKNLDRNGHVVGVTALNGVEKELLIATRKGNVIRIPAKEVSEMGRNTQGVRTVAVGESDLIAGFDTVPATN